MKTGSPLNSPKLSDIPGATNTKKHNKKNNYNSTTNNENKYNSSDSSSQSTSLVKYDTQFLVSTTLSNKKALEELDDSNENAEIFLRNLINKRGSDEKGGEMEDYSVRDA